MQAHRVIGHRGAAAYAPENTLVSFLKAKELGCGFIEFDVAQSQDGELFVFHDRVLNRTSSGQGLIDKVDSDYLKSLDAGFWFSKKYSGTKIPTLKDAIFWLSENNMQANIENKSTEENLQTYIITALIIFIPAGLIAKQPDLGTAIMVAIAGLSVIFVAGISFKIICYVTVPIIMSTPILWYFLHDYQKKRILTLVNPEQDPLGSGYHIIQSKIAIGSGGAFGKGWLVGSQAHLNFLPEHATDFIFAVSGEELGFIGSTVLILIVALVALRCLYISKNADTNYAKLLASGLSMAFFLSAFVNMGMVMGILPVVGIPLPLVSYGGSAMLTFLASFGILMSISSHKIALK